MDGMTDRAGAAEAVACPVCGVPAGSPCRTGSGTTAIVYHTPRLVLVPGLGSVGEVAVPPDRHPGRPWTAPTPVPPAVRLGYAYSAGPADDPSGQRAALRSAGCVRTYVDVTGIAVAARPALDEAIEMGRAQRRSAPDQPVTLIACELSRLARHAQELIQVAGALQACGLRLRLLTGPLAGHHDPGRAGSAFFSVLAAAAQLDRDHRARKSQAAAERGAVGGRPRVIDEAMLRLARTLRDQGVPVPEIARRLTTPTGRHPSVASVYRALADTPPAATTEESAVEHGMD